MFVYSTCRDCGGPLHVTNDDTVHPGCTPKPTKLETLLAQFLAAATADDNVRADELESTISELENRPPRLLDAALLYASWGWPVFPLKPRQKTPATRNGFKDATTDTDRIRAWWNRHPHSNIGLPTGHAFDVIDVDPPGGYESLRQTLAAVDPRTGKGPLPDCHGKVITARGGYHFYIKPTPNGTNKAGFMPGIDIRARGGYVVAPPSTLGAPGRRWSWMVHPSPKITRRAVAA